MMVPVALKVIAFELHTLQRAPMAWALPLLFFVISLSLFAVILEPVPEVLGHVAPLAVWITVVFANLLAQDRYLRRDYEEGSLESLVFSPWPLAWLLLARVAAYWLLTLLPLIVLTALVGLSLKMSWPQVSVLLLSLLLGTPILCLLSHIVSALTLGLSQGGLLLALLLLPLYVPVLIFANGMVVNASQGLPISGLVLLLAGLLLLTLCLAPFAMATALRVGLSQ